jgi:hypothetical protein
MTLENCWLGSLGEVLLLLLYDAASWPFPIGCYWGSGPGNQKMHRQPPPVVQISDILRMRWLTRISALVILITDETSIEILEEHMFGRSDSLAAHP